MTATLIEPVWHGLPKSGHGMARLPYRPGESAANPSRRVPLPSACQLLANPGEAAVDTHGFVHQRAEDWYRRTALADLLQLGEEKVNKDRLYRALDHLLMHKPALEAHLL